MANIDMTWAYVQDFPAPSHGGESQSLYRLQSARHEIEAIVVVGNESLQSSPDARLHFLIDIDPFEHAFNKAQYSSEAAFKEAIKLYERDTVYFVFPAHLDAEDSTGMNRVAATYTSPTSSEPSGPIDFSSALHNVKYAPYDQSSLYQTSKDDIKWEKNPPSKCRWYSWETTRARFINVGALTDPKSLPQAGADALQQFLKLMTAATGDKKLPIQVVTRNVPKHQALWPRFCSPPTNPTPPTYWSWMKPRGINPEDVFDFTKANFELFPDYCIKALCMRDLSWHHKYKKLGKSGQQVPIKPTIAANDIPPAYKIAPFSRRVYFVTNRQYLAYVLGCHTYEVQHKKRQGEDTLDGRQSSQYVDSVRTHLIAVMMNPKSERERWLRRLLSARENTDPIFNKENAGSNILKAPEDWKKIIQQTINKHQLDEEEAKAVRHVYTHRITIISAPMTSGKSKLAVAVLELEETFNGTWWVAVDDNAALNRMTERYCNLKGTRTPDHGIFMTASNSASELMEGYHPTLVLLDEGSLSEAEAIHPFLRAASGEQAKLTRIVIFADTDRSPTTIVDERNPFRNQGNFALTERLTLSGVEPMRLKTQR